jgi:tRNA A-37 threonylcarbamoyl transferase component Bud32
MQHKMRRTLDVATRNPHGSLQRNGSIDPWSCARSMSAGALDRGHARSLRVENGRVIKTWRHPALVQRLRDAARARREREILATLHARGLNVPEPYTLSRTTRGWQLELQYVSDAANVQRLLECRAAWPTGPERGLSALGALLAELHAAGLVQRDLHPGNALVDAQGRAWALDFDKARLVAALPRAQLETDLLELCAYARERTSARQRRRFALAWWRALTPELRARLALVHSEPTPPRAARRALGVWLASIEARAPRRRDAQVRRLVRRWLRESSRTRQVALPGGAMYVARDAGDYASPEALLRDAAARGWITERCASRAQARARWLELAEAFERARPDARPLALSCGPAGNLIVRG